jgi:hypothetical protein
LVEQREAGTQETLEIRTAAGAALGGAVAAGAGLAAPGEDVPPELAATAAAGAREHAISAAVSAADERTPLCALLLGK